MNQAATASMLSNREQLAQKIRSSETLQFGSSVILLTPENREIILQCIDDIRFFGSRLGAVWGNEGDLLKVDINGINLIMENQEEFFILREIHAQGLYDIGITEPVHVIDIGANVLMASLSFAKMEKVLKVTAFEPLKPTHDKALKHLSMNPVLARKIDLRPYGLSDAEKNLSVHYSHAIRGSTRTDSDWDGEPHMHNRSDYEMQSVVLKKASQVIGDVMASSDYKRFVLKVDCEGAESLILRDLAENALLERVSAILLEWHGENRSMLEKLLLDSHFECISIRPQGNPALGMIYGFNTRTAPRYP